MRGCPCLEFFNNVSSLLSFIRVNKEKQIIMSAMEEFLCPTIKRAQLSGQQLKKVSALCLVFAIGVNFWLILMCLALLMSSFLFHLFWGEIDTTYVAVVVASVPVDLFWAVNFTCCSCKCLNDNGGKVIFSVELSFFAQWTRSLARKKESTSKIDFLCNLTCWSLRVMMH